MKNTKNQLPKRDSLGRFVSTTRTNARTTPRANGAAKRDSRGRFVSASTSSNKIIIQRSTKLPMRDDRGRFTSSSGSVRSSFIKSVTVSGNLVNVVMKRNPKITYTYRPTSAGLKEVQKVISIRGSFGTVYNQHLRGREYSRTIYR